jgi:hypothetical protein
MALLASTAAAAGIDWRGAGWYAWTDDLAEDEPTNYVTGPFDGLDACLAYVNQHFPQAKEEGTTFEAGCTRWPTAAKPDKVVDNFGNNLPLPYWAEH